ncbi:hypothetical protein POTOM_008997 [Populus tomentosa]|uniref:Uncharacterized protein n=1 Tax=Populus tomentosa TaxID=118781 RepID=A0A8X8ADF1_POPTO|nr:hypothetical protein POTOM_008997 [Populus tomentosa]
MSGVSASASASSPSHCFYNLQSKIQTKQEIYFVNPPLISCSSSSLSSHIKLKTHLGLRFETALRGYRKINVRCSSSSGPGGPGSASECLCINPITQINLERNQSSKMFLTKGQLWFKDFVENFLKHKGTLGVTNVNNDFRMSSFVTLSMLKRMYSLVAKFHYDFKYFAEDVALDLLFVGIVIDSLALRICDSDSRSVLDAFFLGKAVAEALNERVESAVGEFLSTIGRLQAEQQKQIQDFQEDVLGRAKKAKEQAAREAMEGQGIIPKPATVETTSVNQGVSQTPSPSTANAVKTDSNPATEGPVLGVSSDD